MINIPLKLYFVYMNTYRRNCLLIVILFSIIINCGCIEENTVTLPSPEIEIISVEEISYGKFAVKTKIVKGEGQITEKAELIFEDITVYENEKIIYNIPIQEDKIQVDSIIIDTKLRNHDFNISLKLLTNKYEYISYNHVIRSKKNNFEFTILQDARYSFNTSTIAKFLNRGSNVTIIMYYDNKITSESFEIKLNKTIPLEHNLNFINYLGEDKFNSFIEFIVPQDIEPGEYDIYVYIDGFEFKVDSKIKVLEGEWDLFNNSFTDGPRLRSSWFILNNELFLIGGQKTDGSQPVNTIWNLNLNDNTWARFNDFPVFQEYDKWIIPTNNLSNNNKGYILCNNADTIEIWEYEYQNKTWEKITNYPGQYVAHPISFTLNGNIYIGGGVDLDSHITHYELWKYNFNAGNWARCNDVTNIVETCTSISNTYCTSENKLYFFTYNGKFFEYDPILDCWTLKERYTGPDRGKPYLTYMNNRIYLLAGYAKDSYNYPLLDCWDYNILTGKWELNSLMSVYSDKGIAFSFDNKVICGMGQIQVGYHTYNDPYLYKLNPQQ